MSDFVENLSKELSPEDFVIGTAMGKLHVIVEQMKQKNVREDASKN